MKQSATDPVTGNIDMVRGAMPVRLILAIGGHSMAVRHDANWLLCRTSSRRA